MIKNLRLFFTGITIAALAIMLTGTSYAQTFQIEDTEVSIQGAPDSFVEPHTDVTNLTSSTLRMQIEIIENTFPQDWSVTICLANCFAPGVTKVTDEMEGGMTYPLKLTITTGPEPGSGCVTMVLQNVDNPAESKTVKFCVSTTSTSVNDLTSPRQLVLAQNYPNPVSLGGSAVTTISYGIPRAAQVTLKVYNLLGKEIRTLVSEQRTQGLHSTLWDGRDKNGTLVPPGVYVYKLSNGKTTQTRRMLLTR